jgi:PleD family two-component response regulator
MLANTQEFSYFGVNTQGPITQSGGSPEPSAQAARPRILFADAGRVARGPVGEELRPYFDVRPVADGEAAWQAVLLDSSIRVVVADCVAPALKGMDLIARMRASKVQRIRDMPVIALVDRVGGAESPRAVSLQATEMAVANPPAPDAGREMDTRLRVLLELANTRDALAESKTELDSARTVDPETELLTLPNFDKQVDKLISYARRALSDLALICIRVELTSPKNDASDEESEQRMKLVGRALSASIRLEDLATRSDKTEFCVATQNNGMTDMLRFAARLRKVLENVDAAGPGVEVWTCIGIATVSEELRRTATDLRGQAQKRAQMAQSSRSRRIMLGATDAAKASGFDPRSESGSMDVSLALALINSGRAAEVVPHLPHLLQHLNPLLRLIRQQQNQVAAAAAANATQNGAQGRQ